MVQWLRIRLSVQGTWVQYLVREDHGCLRPELQSLQAETTEARAPWSLSSATEATTMEQRVAPGRHN